MPVEKSEYESVIRTTDEKTNEEEIPCYFRYEGGSSQQVLLFGSFDDWKNKIPLVRQADVFGRGEFWEVTIPLPVGRHEFLFLVDGEYKVNPNIVSCLDSWGNTNNYIIVEPLDKNDVSTKHNNPFELTSVLEESQSQVQEALQTLEIPEKKENDVNNGTEDHSGLASIANPPRLGPRRPSLSPRTAQVVKPEPSWVSRQQRSALLWHSLNPEQPTVEGTEEATAPPATLTNFQLRERHQLRNEWELETDKRRSMKRSQSVMSVSASHKGFGHELGISDSHLPSSRERRSTIQVPLVNGTVTTELAKSTTASRTHLDPPKTLLALVGLPARGKTYISGIIRRHLSWQGQRVGLVNVGNYRRKLFGSQRGCEFFDPSNSSGATAREEAASAALEDALNLLDTELDLVIYDATNTTRARREYIVNTVAARNAANSVSSQGADSPRHTPRRQTAVHCMFLEIVCNDEDIIRSNLRETKLHSPDYSSMDPEAAIDDFLKRIDFYKQVYQPLDDAHEGRLSYLKLIDVGRQLVANRLHSAGLQILPLVANLHITPRPIYLVRHGESVDNTQQRIGGDSSLSALGMQFANLLGKFLNNTFEDACHQVPVWTSTLRRTNQSCAHLGPQFTVRKWRALDEIDAGACDGMTYEEIAECMPRIYEERKLDKWNFRWPQGESYQDLFFRVEPVIMEILRHESPLVIVAHQAVLRIIYGYLTNVNPEECPMIAFPQHAVVQLTPRAYGCDEVIHEPLLQQQ